MRQLLPRSLLLLSVATLACSTHVLEYFDAAGRAEVIRIALHSAGVDFTDKRYGWEEWQTIKANSEDWVYKNGLPVLTTEDGQKFSQSLAQMRYAARKGNLYSDDLRQAMRIDEVMDIVQDILAKTPSPPDQEEKKKQREEYGAGKMHSFMSRINQIAEQSNTPFVAGTDELSMADLVVWQLLTMIRTGDFDHIPSDYADKYMKLSLLEATVPDHPVVAAYYQKKKNEL